MNALKDVSSRRYGQAGFKKPYGGEALWTRDFVSSVGGALVDVLKRYIQEQEKLS